MTASKALERLVESFRTQTRIRTGSLIITLYGDAIEPRGGMLWLSSLIALMQPFGIGERLVRTSVFRLVKDGWLEARKFGRQSAYGLTPGGTERLHRAAARIYQHPGGDWDGVWTLVMVPGLDSKRREHLARELRWSGFGAVANGVFAHPGKDGSEVLQITSERDLEGKVMVFSATAHDAENMLKVQRSLVDAGWPLGELAQRYSEFIREFAPLEKQLGKGASIEPAEAYQLRILVLHQYRRILLRDPTLPVRLLPTAWPGLRAYELCKNIYKNVYADAEQYLDESAACPDGRLPKPGAPFFRRFGGLRK